MQVWQALKRIRWRFSTGKSFKPNQNDIEAYNALDEFHENLKKQNIKQNLGFAKLFIALLTIYIKHYDSDLFDREIQKKLIEIVKSDPRNMIEQLTDWMNRNEASKLSEYLLEEHQITYDNRHTILEYANEQQKNIILGEEIYTYQDVSEIVQQMINHAYQCN